MLLPNLDTTRNDPQIDFPTRAFTIRSESVNEEQRSVQAVIATENVAAVFDYESYRVIDEIILASGAEFGRSVPLLENHFRYSTDAIYGSVRDIAIEGNQVTGRLHLADGDDQAQRAWNKIRQGHLTDVSVGYRALEFQDIPPGQSATINGRSYKAGQRTLRITTKWKIREVSLVPIGADDAAKIRSSFHPAIGDPNMPKNVRLFLESIGLRAEATEQEAQQFFDSLPQEVQTRAEAYQPPQPATPPASNPPSPQPSPVPTPDIEEARRQAVTQERNRVAMIRERAGSDIPQPLVERAISEGWDEPRVNAEFLTHIRSQRQPPVVPFGRVSNPDRDCNERSLAAALFSRLAGDPLQAEFRGQRGDLLNQNDAQRGDRYRNSSLVDLCRMVCEMTGALDPDTGARPYGRDGYVRAAVSTSALANIFSTSIHARMVAAYQEAGDTTMWCSEEEVANFQTQDRVSMGKTSALEKLPRGETAKHASIGDSVESYKIARYAKQFVIDEQDFYDDNLNGLQEMPREMGLAAGRLRPDLVYSILLANAALSDTVALFHTASHGNLASSALDSTSLAAGVVAMWQQKLDNVRLNLRPKYLIVPGNLWATAAALITSTSVIAAGDADVVLPSRNVLTDLSLQLIVEGRIDAAGVTDPNSGTAYTGSATNWFMAADNARTVRVGYLAGTGRRPTMRRFVLDRGQYGLGWDIKMDIGAKALDYRGLYKGNG